MVSERGYLVSERGAAFKHEFWAGRVIRVPDVSYRHALLTARIQAHCGLQLRDHGMAALGCLMRVYVEAVRAFVYPDVVLVRHQPAFFDDEQDTITNPHALIEIASPETLEHDRGRKLRAYQAIPSLVDYVLVMENEVMFEHHRREEGRAWRRTEHGRGGELVMGADVRLSASTVYSWK